jgi:hypothetical protein
MANPHPVSRRGKPNKASSARIERLIEQGKRLPPEDLLLAAELYAGMAARYQPMNTNADTGTRTRNRNHNEERYSHWLAAAREANKAAAPYFTPSLRAVLLGGSAGTSDSAGGFARSARTG